MKNTQLFEILGEIDNKFYDEALGGDSEKPLKIDTSRKPLKWYRIAAPIAACLVLGVGIFTISRFINMPFPVDPPAISDMSYTPDVPVTSCTSATEADLETCRQMLLKKYPDVGSFSTRIMDINLDGVDEAVIKGSSGDHQGIYIFSKTESGMVWTGYIDTALYEHCLFDLNGDLKLGDRYWYFKYAGENAGVYAEAVARITYNGGEYVVDYPAAAYCEGYSHGGIDNLTLKRSWSPKYDLYGEGEDNGFEILGSDFISIWEGYFTLGELNADFADYLTNDDNAFAHDVEDFFPDIDLKVIPLMDSASFDLDDSPVIRRARLATARVCYEVDAYAALVGENIFRLSEDGSEYMRMEKLSVIYYYNNTLYAQVYLEPVAPGGGRGNFILRAKKDLPISAHHFNYTLDYSLDIYGKETKDTAHVIAVGGDDFMRTPELCTVFVRLNTRGAIAGDNTKPKLTVLKGIPADGDTPTAYINLSSDRADSKDALINNNNNISTKISFFTEMFDYADPDAAHAHFKCKVISINGMGGGLGGRRYYFNDDDTPTLGITPEEALGSEEDLARFKDFISSDDIAVIHAVTVRKPGPLSESNAINILDTIKNAEFGIFTKFPDPPTGGIDDDIPNPFASMERSADEFYIYGCGSDGSILFSLYHNAAWVSVVFGDQQTCYLFEDINRDIYGIDDYLGYDDD